MSSHIRQTYLSTYFKVPIDPCTNCPAPSYNRPKIYLERTSITPLCSSVKTTKHSNGLPMEARSSCEGIRTLAKFYESIPDYGDLHHLSGAEFNSTLDTLRSTCRQLKDTTISVANEDYYATTTTSTSSSVSSNNDYGGSRCKKTKKSKEKKKSGTVPNKCKSSKEQESINTNQTWEKKNQSPLLQSANNLERDIEKEVEVFKKSLQEFEAEFKRPLIAETLNQSRPQTRSPLKEVKEKSNKDNDVLTEEFRSSKKENVPVRNTLTSALRERLRKSLSYNDLNTITEPLELLEFQKKNKTLERLSFKGYKNKYKDPSKLSSYFPHTTGIPEITVNSPEHTEKAYDKSKLKKKQNKSKGEEYKMAFNLFDLETTKKPSSLKHTTPSPVHPVARPNLAATLRLESSKKKVNELKNNCTYHDTTPQFDWEVRKTPAWKTLSLNESHKEILRLRLATRKAEQALQQREYELNMEIMRQRVKSAPLLLEGPTYWGPDVGKLTHDCQKEGRRHMCQSNQQRTKRRKNSSRAQTCRRNLIFGSSSAMYSENNDVPPQTYRVQMSSRKSDKLNTLRKIYSCASGSRSRSRNSIYTTNSQQSQKNSLQKSTGNLKSNREKPIRDNDGCSNEIDSADELSSYDRAFL